MSPTQLSISVLGASGMFSTTDYLTRSSAWPAIAYSFPSAYASLISSFVGTKIYVDSVLGNDNNNGTSPYTPFATITKAHTYRDTLAANTNCAIAIAPGAYTMAPYYDNGTTSAVLSDYSTTLTTSRPTTYICAPGKVVISWTSSASRDGCAVTFANSTSNVYGAIFVRNNGGKTTSYSTAFFNNTTSAGSGGKFYNCVFSEVNANNNWSIMYDNAASAIGYVYNCSFYVQAAGLSDYSSGPNFVLTNCVYNWAYTSSTTNTTPLILSSHNMNSSVTSPIYSSPGTSTQGVYYGTYSWSTP